MIAASLQTWMPWNDRAGRVSWLKFVCLIALSLPALWMAYKWQAGLLSPKPMTDLIRESGDWAMRILIASLAVTPLRYVARFNRIIMVRRMLGLAALYYTLAHIVFWCIDLRFAWMTIALELVLRLFLTIGLAATLLLVALGITSNDASIHALGARRWNKLHATVYLATLLSLVHYFMEVRLDASEAALLCGFFVLLMFFRAVRKRVTPGFFNLAATAVVSGVVTALIEVLYYKLSTNVTVMRVLQANLEFSYTIRPAWWVLMVGVLIAVLAELRARFAPKARA
jgi:sulfoxide reductase heme-binding subunit YedZ